MCEKVVCTMFRNVNVCFTRIKRNLRWSEVRKMCKNNVGLEELLTQVFSHNSTLVLESWHNQSYDLTVLSYQLLNIWLPLISTVFFNIYFELHFFLKILFNLFNFGFDFCFGQS